MGSKKTTTTTKTELPGWYTNAMQDLIAAGNVIADEPYIQYPGERIAPFSAEQQQAFNLVNQSASDYAGQIPLYQDKIASATERMGQPATMQDLQPYMNPYLESVIDITQRDALEEYNDLQAKLNLAKARQGSFGFSRHGVAEAELQSDFLKQYSDIGLRGRAEAFDRAQNLYRDDLFRTPGFMQQAAASQAEIPMKMAPMLEAVGVQKQAQDQRALDVAYGDFLEERDWNLRGLNAQASAVSGVPGNLLATQTQTSKQPGPGVGQVIGGLATTAIGAYLGGPGGAALGGSLFGRGGGSAPTNVVGGSSFGNVMSSGGAPYFGSYGNFYKDGGLVKTKKYASGGFVEDQGGFNMIDWLRRGSPVPVPLEPGSGVSFPKMTNPRLRIPLEPGNMGRKFNPIDFTTNDILDQLKQPEIERKQRSSEPKFEDVINTQPEQTSEPLSPGSEIMQSLPALPAPKSREEKAEDNSNFYKKLSMPLIKAGLTMMSTPGPIGEVLGKAGIAAVDEVEAQRDRKAKLAQRDFENTILQRRIEADEERVVNEGKRIGIAEEELRLKYQQLAKQYGQKQALEMLKHQLKLIEIDRRGEWDVRSSALFGGSLEGVFNQNPAKIPGLTFKKNPDTGDWDPS